MLKGKNLYQRKLTIDEVRNNYVLITKEALPLFPHPGKPFKISCQGKKYDSTVLGVECWCQGTRKPHWHYRIDLTPFLGSFSPRPGKRLSIEKKKEKVFELIYMQ